MALNLRFKTILIAIGIIVSCMNIFIASEDTPSYVKFYRSETAILKELNGDFANLGVGTYVDNMTYAPLMNYSSAEFPGFFLDITNIKAAGSEFSISNAMVLNSNTTIIATDATNSSFIFFSGDYVLTNATVEEKGNFSVIMSSAQITYMKELTKLENKISFTGLISLMFKDGEFKFNNDSHQHDIVIKAFNEHFSYKIKPIIEGELNVEIKKYLENVSYDKIYNFTLFNGLSKNPFKLQALDLKLTNMDTLILTSKYDSLVTFHYTGYLPNFANKTLPPANSVDLTKIDLSKLYRALFIDKFLFESLTKSEAFNKFFIRNTLKNSDIPEALDFDLTINDLSKVIPEVSYSYSLLEPVYANFAFFNPRIQFEDDQYPSVFVKLDFTFYVKEGKNSVKQIYTCTVDLVFNLKIVPNNQFRLNFEFDLVDVVNLNMSNNYNYVDIEALKFIIREIVGASTDFPQIKLFEKDVDLCRIFEEKYSARYFKHGVFLYDNLD